MGIYNGVAAQLQRRNGHHVAITHCINHGLELAIVDMRKEESYITEFESSVKVINKRKIPYIVSAKMYIVLPVIYLHNTNYFIFIDYF